MIKNRPFAILLVFSSLAFFSCSDDDGTSSTTTTVQPPKTLAEANALVNSIYGPLQTLSSSYSFLVESATETTISFEEKDDSKDGPQVSVLETVPSNWYPIKVCNRLYKSISAANSAIELIGKASSVNINDSIKGVLQAKAQFIRGYDYFQLVQLFGEVPLITTTSPTTTEQTTRKSIDEVYAQAIKDLTEASAKLPWYDSNKSVPTKWAAKTILAKVYLTWGQKPLTQEEVTAISSSTQDPTKPAVDVQKLTRAVELADSVIKSNKYAILDNFNDIWGVGNENNDEVIFSIHHDGDGIDSQGNHQTHCGFTWPKSERTDPHISYADITLENLLPDGDARKLYSLVTKVSYKDGNIDTLTWPLSIVRPGKWIHRSQEGTNIALDNQPNNIDHIDFRLAEVYLIKAEAQFFLNSGDEGLAAINKLRERANVQPLSSVTQQDLFNEWSYEFTFEQKNWLNLVRWRTLISSVKKVTGYEYYKAAYNDQTQFNALSGADPTRFAFYQRIYKHLHAKADHINGHFYRFPIPLSESYTSQGITPQNPGY